MWGDRLIAFVEKIKSMGFCVKTDTNGSNPRVLQALIEKRVIDYVALDFKAPIYKLEKICGKDYFKEFEESLNLLRDSTLSYEIRTTFHSDLLSPAEIGGMRDWLKERGYEGKYYVQGFVGDKGSLGNLGVSDNQSLKQIEGIVYRGIL